VHWLTALVGVGLVFADAVPVLSQTSIYLSQPSYKTRINEQVPIVDSIEFLGLRHISSAAVKVQLSLLPGDRFDAAKLDRDIRTLARLGWFSAIRVEETSRTPLNPQKITGQKRIVLAFYFSEEPILSRVEYSGSRLLSTNQIEKLLEEKKLSPGLGKPSDPAALWGIALAIRSALNELRHPEGSVQALRQSHETAPSTCASKLTMARISPFDRFTLKETRASRKNFYAHKCKASRHGNLWLPCEVRTPTHKRHLSRTASAS